MMPPNTFTSSDDTNSQKLVDDILLRMFENNMLAATSLEEITKYLLVNRYFYDTLKPLYNEMHAFYIYDRVSKRRFLSLNRSFRSDCMVHTEKQLSKIRIITAILWSKEEKLISAFDFAQWRQADRLSKMNIVHWNLLTEEDFWHPVEYGIDRVIDGHRNKSSIAVVQYKSAAIVPITSPEDEESAETSPKAVKQLAVYDCKVHSAYKIGLSERCKRSPYLRNVPRLSVSYFEKLTLGEKNDQLEKEQTASSTAHELKVPDSTTFLTLSHVSFVDRVFTIQPHSMLTNLSLVRLKNFDLCSTLKAFCQASMTLKHLRIASIHVAVAAPSINAPSELILPASLQSLVMLYVKFDKPVTMISSKELVTVVIVQCEIVDYDVHNGQIVRTKTPALSHSASSMSCSSISSTPYSYSQGVFPPSDECMYTYETGHD